MPGATQDAVDIVTKLSGSQVKLEPSDKGDKADGDGTAAGSESTVENSTLGTYEVIANGQVRFTPAVSDLDVDVPMVFKASDKEISKETDLEDTDQTIDIEKAPEGKNLDQTGNWILYAAIAAGVAACIAGIVLIHHKRKI